MPIKSYTKVLKRTPSPARKTTHNGDQISAHSHSETQARGHHMILSPSHSLDQSHGNGTSLSLSHSKTTRSHSEVIGGEVLHTNTLKQTGSPSHIMTEISNHISVLTLILMVGVILFSLPHTHQIMSLSHNEDREVIIISSSPCYSPDCDSAASDTWKCKVSWLENLSGHIGDLWFVLFFILHSPDLAILCDPGPSTKGTPRYDSKSG